MPMVITVTMDPFALALLEPPGALGADIAVGEGQPLGLPPQGLGHQIGVGDGRPGHADHVGVAGADHLIGLFERAEAADDHGRHGHLAS